jgi:hypothetical protein
VDLALPDLEARLAVDLAKAEEQRLKEQDEQRKKIQTMMEGGCLPQLGIVGPEVGIEEF